MKCSRLLFVSVCRYCQHRAEELLGSSESRGAGRIPAGAPGETVGSEESHFHRSDPAGLQYGDESSLTDVHQVPDFPQLYIYHLLCKLLTESDMSYCDGSINVWLTCTESEGGSTFFIYSSVARKKNTHTSYSGNINNVTFFYVISYTMNLKNWDNCHFPIVFLIHIFPPKNRQIK